MLTFTVCLLSQPVRNEDDYDKFASDDHRSHVTVRVEAAPGNCEVHVASHMSVAYTAQ